MRRLRFAAGQLDLVVGDLDHNVGRLVRAARDAEADGVDVVAFPELAITGYPPEDLLLKPGFVGDGRRALAQVAEATGDVVVVVGFVDRDGPGLANAAAVCHRGEVVGIYRKRRLPNYAVFDEQRYFTAGTEPLRLYEVAGVRVGVTICEDAWAPGGPMLELAQGGAELLVNLNASPYHAGKLAHREQALADRGRETGLPIAYVNLVGGQDELVFDGASLVVDADGRVLTRAGHCTDELLVTDLEVGPTPTCRGPALPVTSVSATSRADGPVLVAVPAAPPSRWHEVYEALVLGTRDYVGKSGFTDVVIGLSGGVDSSLVAAVAVDALGPQRVHGVLMPSRYSSDHSITDAEALAGNLGIEHRTIEIEPAFSAFLDLLAPSFEGLEADATEENLQARIRGVLLMALSNKLGWMVLTTGNKSETAVGYSTLYGDMAGGFAVLKDVPKTWVYELCLDRNERAGRELVPASVIAKPPSAELRPGQQDTDSLPPYEDLDRIVEAYVEHDRTLAELVAAGEDEALVRRIVGLIDGAEHKRRQGPPGPRVTTKAFGKDRRVPIVNGYRGLHGSGEDGSRG